MKKIQTNTREQQTRDFTERDFQSVAVLRWILFMV